MFRRKIGKKQQEWMDAKKVLIEEYRDHHIYGCEGWWLNKDACNPTWALSFHHLDKRSTGRAQHTFEETRLLCPNCHTRAEYNKDFNEQLRNLR